MKPLQLYGLKKCSTCVKALAWLDERKIAWRFTDYRDEPVSRDQLLDWKQQLGDWPKLVNRASMTWRNLPDALKTAETDEQWLALIADHPTLVRRPVLVQENGQLSVGFSDKKYSELVG